MENRINIRELHGRFKDHHSPSPEMQIKWLAKQGFAPYHIEQAMLKVYDEVASGKTFLNGFELDQYLLTVARDIQNKEATDQLMKIEKFYTQMKDKWEKEKEAKSKKSFWQKIGFKK